MRILLPLDASDCSEAAAQFLARRMTAAGNDVHILHVVDIFETLPFCYGYAPARGVEKVERQKVWQGEELVAQAARKLRAAGFSVTTRVEVGDPKGHILSVAAEWKADLIVMGSHGRRGVDRFFLGSVSEGVIRQACCSVEIVRIPTTAAHDAADSHLTAMPV